MSSLLPNSLLPTHGLCCCFLTQLAKSLQQHWQVFYEEAKRTWPQLTSEELGRTHEQDRGDADDAQPMQEDAPEPAEKDSGGADDAQPMQEDAPVTALDAASAGLGDSMQVATEAPNSPVAHLAERISTAAEHTGRQPTSVDSAVEAQTDKPDRSPEPQRNPEPVTSEPKMGGVVEEVPSQALPDPACGVYVCDGSNIMLENILTRQEFLECGGEGGSSRSRMAQLAMMKKVREYMAVQDDEGTFATPVTCTNYWVDAYAVAYRIVLRFV